MTDSSKRIALINAYQQMIGISLKLSKYTPEETAAVVQSEFQDFIQGRINELLNGKKPAEESAKQFSPEDVEVLRALIDGVRAKQRGVASPAGKPAAKYDQPTGTTRSSGAKPIIDSDPDGLRYRNEQISILKSLEKMDNEGPEY